MKILTVSTTRFHYNGITNSIMNYYRYMDKSSLRMDFLVPYCLEELKEEIYKNGDNIFEFSNRKTNPIGYFWNLYKLLKKNKYDIIHIHGNSSTLLIELSAANLAGIKHRIVHSRNSDANHKFFHKLFRPLLNRMCNHSFACGKLAGEWMFGKKTFEIITNGNDLEKYKFNNIVRKEFRSKLNISSEIVIGHVGRFNYQKNHEFLIDTFYHLCKLNDNYKLVLIGDGVKRNSIEKKVEELCLSNKVKFIGNSTIVEKYLQAFDIMVFPSRFEGLPNVVIEWQIAGLKSFISNNITDEVKITPLVNFLSIDSNPTVWAKQVNSCDLPVDREQDNIEIQELISNAGFNITENAKRLKQLYENMVIEK